MGRSKRSTDVETHPAASAMTARSVRLRERSTSVPSLTDDSQIGANLRICADEKIEQIAVPRADREGLERLVRDRKTPQKVVWRAGIVLLASDGLTAEAIAAAAGKSLLTVRRWRQRYVAKGVDGLLKDATRPSRVKPREDQAGGAHANDASREAAKATHWSACSSACR